MIPYGKQNIAAGDIIKVNEALQSDFLTTGPKVSEFEKKFADYIGVSYAVAVSSGTAALHLACLAAGLKENEEMITTPLSFAASANCALYCNAKPVFADITEQGLIDPDEIPRKISPKTKMIIPVHYGGLPCDLEKIREIADTSNLTVIEDACHALGARYKNSRIGDCKYSLMACFSFHPVKHITTGEGGMITTNSKEMYEKLILLRSHGITKDPKKLLNLDEGPWHQEMQELGFNYRLTDFQCALGMSQLSKMEEFLEKRRRIAFNYNEKLKFLFERKIIETLNEDSGRFNSYHLYVIKLRDQEIRLRLYHYLKALNILCQVHFLPIYLHPYYQRRGYPKGLCPNAEEFYERILSLPIYPGLTDEEQDKVIRSIQFFFEVEK